MHRRFGQHLLIDDNIVNREIKYAEISRDDVILEVGPGKGILTKLLAEKAK
ncbi:MAG TPA: ribosomal RNA small subunit methyltransferase A, partial [Thermoplasmatales archaeon]|nr:ribosomal RNA small subunit methyltransferase A [Thermoplasmatales archaeon]